MKESFPIVAISLGIPLVLLSLMWGMIFPASSSWTNEKAQRMSELTRDTHALLFKSVAAKNNPDMKSGESAAELQAQYKASKEELANLRKEFENQRDKPQAMASYLRWSGIGLVLIGAAANFVDRG